MRQGALIVLVCGCGSREPPTQTTAPHYEAHCAEHLPVFTLGENSHPTKAQEAALCACVHCSTAERSALDGRGDRGRPWKAQPPVQPEARV